VHSVPAAPAAVAHVEHDRHVGIVSVRGVVGSGIVRSGFDEAGAVGEIVGVYGQVLIEGDLADGLI
jgi:hypothetical protein